MPAAVAVPLAVGAMTTGATVYASSRAGRSTDRATRAQTIAAERAAQIEAQAAREQLEFLKQQEANRQREWQLTQERNRAIYDADVNREQGRYDDLQRRMQPYRQFGVGALGQLMRPMGSGAGSLGAMVGD